MQKSGIHVNIAHTLYDAAELNNCHRQVRAQISDRVFLAHVYLVNHITFMIFLFRLNMKPRLIVLVVSIINVTMC